MEIQRLSPQPRRPDMWLGFLALACAVLALALTQRESPEAAYLRTHAFAPESGTAPLESGLPVFELEFPQQSLEQLAAALPDQSHVEQLGSFFSTPGNPRWPWVVATFRYDGRSWPVTVRFRGWNYDHYMMRKKSWRVRFPDDDPFFGVAQLNIVNPRERNVIFDVVEHDLLRDMGQTLADQYLVALRINGQVAGVQVAFEQPGPGFLERHHCAEGDLYGEQRHSSDPFTTPELWQKYETHVAENDYSSLDALCKALATKQPGALRELLDVDRYLDFLAESALSASTNPGTHNWRLYYDPSQARFQVLPWYQFGVDWPLNSRYLRASRSRPVDFAYNWLTAVAFQDPDLVDLYHRKLDSLSQGQAALPLLLARVNAWADRSRRALYADPNKHSITHFTFERRYFSNAEWEQSINELQRCLVVRHDYVRRFLGQSELRAELAPVAPGISALRVTNLGRIPTRLTRLSFTGAGPSEPLRVYRDSDGDGVWTDHDNELAKATPQGASGEISLRLTIPVTHTTVGTTRDAYSDATIVSQDLSTRPVEHLLFVVGGSSQLSLKALDAHRTLGERGPLRVDRTNGALHAAPPPQQRPRVRVIEIPVATATPERHGYRLGVFVSGGDPVTVEDLSFDASDPAPDLRVVTDTYDEAGNSAPQRLVNVPGAATVRVAWAASPPLDTFPGAQPHVALPLYRQLKVLCSGAPARWPRLTSGSYRDAQGELHAVEIVRAASLEPLSLPHSGPGYDPVPPRPDGEHPQLRPGTKKTVTWTGTRTLDRTLRLPADTRLVLEPGTRVRLAPEVSLHLSGQLIARGTLESPVVFERAGEAAWGSLALQGAGSSGSVLEHCELKGGSSATVGSVTYTGALAVHHADVALTSCRFSESSGDDTVNCKNGTVSIVDCDFAGGADALDLDFCRGEVRRCSFRDPTGDALDLSGSTVTIVDCTIRGATDKGISSGERSTLRVVNCEISACGMGVASKDRSRTQLIRCTLAGNAIGGAVYRKKLHFGGARLELLGSIVWANRLAFQVDPLSSVSVAHSAIQGEPGDIRGLIQVDDVSWRGRDPLLKNLEEGALGLRAESPCQGVGDPKVLPRVPGDPEAAPSWGSQPFPRTTPH